jgi:hypothetical protein
MCIALSFPVCRCPAVGGRQKQTYNNVDALRSETARDKPPHIPSQCRTASEVDIDDFDAGEALLYWCYRFDYTHDKHL